MANFLPIVRLRHAASAQSNRARQTSQPNSKTLYLGTQFPLPLAYNYSGFQNG
ncbi:MAG: hypothetical protein WCA35_31440 [Kovacikia sp.]